jgi:multidrug resistance efflux pump
MTRLKKRIRIDTMRTEVRARKGQIGRYIYLGLLALVLLSALNIIFGDLFFLQSPGLVMRDSVVVATEYSGRIVELPVKEGDIVKKGDLMVRMESQDVAQKIADIRYKAFDAQKNLSDLESRATLLAATQGPARARSSQLQQTLQNFKNLKESGLLSSNQMTGAVNNAYQSLSDTKSIEAETNAIQSSIPMLQRSMRETVNALEDLERIYNKGKLLSGVDGVIANLRTAPGAVVSPGQAMMEIYHNKSYVVAQIPAGTLYQIDVGDAIQVKIGISSYSGVVSKIYPVASELPAEFQKTFQPKDRRQLIRVDFTGEAQDIPLFTKVEISRPWLGLSASVAVP